MSDHGVMLRERGSGRAVTLSTVSVAGGLALFGDEDDGTRWQVGIDRTGRTVDLLVGRQFRVARQDQRTWRRDGRALFAVDGADELVAPAIPGGWTALLMRRDLAPGPVDVAVLDDLAAPSLRPSRAMLEHGPAGVTARLDGAAPVVVAQQADGSWLDTSRWTSTPLDGPDEVIDLS